MLPFSISIFWIFGIIFLSDNRSLLSITSVEPEYTRYNQFWVYSYSFFSALAFVSPILIDIFARKIQAMYGHA